MNKKVKILFSEFTLMKWRNLVLTAIVCFSLIYIFAIIRTGAVADDFAAYWSVGRISIEKGFSQIYELDTLREVYSHEIKEQGYIFDLSNKTYSVPYLPVFVLPFQLLSRVELRYSYWIWNIINLSVLFAYLIFFLQHIGSRNEASTNYLYLLVLVLISSPVIKNLASGNVNVFLLICTGEFLRNAVNNKPLLSGIWLGGLLLKPPLLILIIPLFFIKRNWDVLKGFFVSSGAILLASVFLAGFTGMKALINLWIKYPSDTFSNTAPEFMINWRMIGFNLANKFNMPVGWVISVIGIILTMLAVYYLTKNISNFGSPSWVIAVLGVFSATLAITWHSLFYMAMVIIPFLIYASVYKMIPGIIIFLWGIVPPVAMFGMYIIGLFDYSITKFGIIEFEWLVVTFSGFVMNLVILYSTVKYIKIMTRSTD